MNRKNQSSQKITALYCRLSLEAVSYTHLLHEQGHDQLDSEITEYRRSNMEHLPKKIHQNGISYTLVGDYYIPDLKLPEESRPIGRWGRMHKAFLQEHRPGQYNACLLYTSRCV